MSKKICFNTYGDWEDIFKKLDSDSCKELVLAVFSYGIRKEIPTMSFTVDLAFAAIKPLMDRDWEKYMKIVERNSLNSKNAGRPKKLRNNPNNPVDFLDFQNNPNNPVDNLEIQTPQIINNKIINKQEDNIEKNNIKKESAFKPPTIEEIAEYAQCKGYEFVDAEAFWNFYESKGWYVGKNKMKKWHCAVANWNKREKEEIENGTSRNNSGKLSTTEKNFREAASEHLRQAPKSDVGQPERNGNTLQTELPFD